MSRDVEKFWDSASKNYRCRQWEKSNIARFDYEITKKLILRFLKLHRNDSILEIGCGPGIWTKIVAGRCKKVVAVDISKKMVNEAKKYCKGKNIHFMYGSFMDLKLNERFDKIFAIRAIEYIKDKEVLFRKINLLLKDGGKLVIITKTKPCLWDFTKKVKNLWQEKISCKELKKLLEKNGFANIIIKPCVIRLPIFASGNREFPLIGKKHELKILKFFRKVTETAQKRKTICIPMLLSESYMVYAEKVRKMNEDKHSPNL